MTSILKTNAIEPQSGTTLTIGQSGQNVVVDADSIKNNVLKDAGGNAVFTSNGSGVLSGLNAGFGSAQALISTTTISSSVASVDITTGIDSTYKLYKWEFINIHPATEEYYLEFQVNASGQTGFDEAMTTTMFRARHGENGSSGELEYRTSMDQANGTVYQPMGGPGAEADEATSGFLFIANPASTTLVKQFWGEQQSANWDSYTWNTFFGGYVNITSAITEISFKMASGDIDGGIIKMYGLKT